MGDRYSQRFKLRAGLEFPKNAVVTMRYPAHPFPRPKATEWLFLGSHQHALRERAVDSMLILALHSVLLPTPHALRSF